MAGTISATGIKDGASERITIPPMEWNNLTWDRNGQVDRISFRHDPSPCYREVLLKGSNVRTLWRAESVGVRKAKSSAADEARCRKALVALMQSGPDNPLPKAKLRERFPDVSIRAFHRAFINAVTESGAPAWSAPGRRPKKS